MAVEEEGERVVGEEDGGEREGVQVATGEGSRGLTGRQEQGIGQHGSVARHQHSSLGHCRHIRRKARSCSTKCSPQPYRGV